MTNAGCFSPKWDRVHASAEPAGFARLDALQGYVVFVDESFYKFFDFSTSTATSFTAQQACGYEGFCGSMAGVVEGYAEAFQRSEGRRPKELKSSDLYKLEFAERRRLILKLRRLWRGMVRIPVEVDQ